MEPLTASGASLAKALSAIKDFPLWLLTAISLSLAVFLGVPAFTGAVSENTRTWFRWQR
jgi:hypothetical protein